MKYQVGDILLIKDIRPRPRLRRRLRPRPHLLLHNTIGIITEVEKHSDIFEKDSTPDDNGYIWYSQVDGREYYFYQDEVAGEVLI
jgi:hypothetical protein